MSLEKQIEAITSAVNTSKESTEAEIKSLKDELVKTQDELAEVKAAGVNMPVEHNEKNILAEAKAKFFAAAATGYDQKGIQVNQMISESKGITVEGPNEAGEAIEQELASKILVPAQEDYAIIADMGTETVSSPNFERVVQTQRSSAVWGGENTANVAPGQTDTPKFVRVTAKFAKLTADNFITNEAVKDPKYDLESFLINDTRVQVGRAMAQGAISGDGTGDNPKGLLAHFDLTESAKPDESRGKEYFGEIKSTGGSLPADDQALITLLKDLEIAIKTPYLAKSKWYVNRETYKRLSMMKDGQDRFYIQPDLSGKSKGMLFGYPIMVEAFLQDDKTVGNRPVIFGDMNKSFKLVRYTGLSMLRNPYIVPGNINFHWEMRLGTIIGDSDALKAIVIAA